MTEYRIYCNGQYITFKLTRKEAEEWIALNDGNTDQFKIKKVVS